jgi:hypothetical protein
MGDATAATLLRAWERAGATRGPARAVALAAAAAELDPGSVWDLPLGARDALLLALRGRCFGTAVSATVTCPGCREELDVDLDLAELGATGHAAAEQTLELEGTTVAFRPVTSRDVAAALGTAQPRPDLVLRCVLGAGSAGAPDLVEAVAARLADADPDADLGVDLSCAACGHRWRAPFDVAEHVWADVDAGARRLLLDVHRLACAYGWREPDVLALSAARRQYYLELVDR